MTCKNCGAHIAGGMLFCSECGTFQTVMKPHFCGKCGDKMTDNEDPVCAACRAKEAAPVPEPTPAPEPTPEPEPSLIDTDLPYKETTLSEKINKSGRTGRFIIVALVIIILCELLYYLLAGGGMDKIKATMAMNPTKQTESASSAKAEPALPPSSTAEPALPPSSTAEPALPPSSTAEQEESSLPASASLPTYRFEDWGAKIEEMRQKYQPVSSEFIAVPGAEELSNFKNGIARIKAAGKWWFITDPGENVKTVFDVIMPFSEGMAAVSDGKKWGYAIESRAPQKVLPREWESAGAFSEGYAVVSRGGKFGLIDKSGQVVIEPAYENMRDCGSGLMPVFKDGKWGFIDLNNQRVIPFDYDDAGPFRAQLAVVTKDGRSFYIDTAGNPVTREYDDAWSFNENLTAKVKAGGKYGLITTDGSFLIRPEWDNIWNLQEGVATVQRDGKYGYVSEKDNLVVVQPVYSDVWSSGLGVIPVKAANGKWGYVDHVGNTVIEPQYDEAYNFADGVARVGISGKYGLIDINATAVSGFEYKLMGYVSEGYCPVMTEGGEWGYLKIAYR